MERTGQHLEEVVPLLQCPQLMRALRAALTEALVLTALGVLCIDRNPEHQHSQMVRPTSGGESLLYLTFFGIVQVRSNSLN